MNIQELIDHVVDDFFIFSITPYKIAKKYEVTEQIVNDILDDYMAQHGPEYKAELEERRKEQAEYNAYVEAFGSLGEDLESIYRLNNRILKSGPQGA